MDEDRGITTSPSGKRCSEDLGEDAAGIPVAEGHTGKPEDLLDALHVDLQAEVLLVLGDDSNMMEGGF